MTQNNVHTLPACLPTCVPACLLICLSVCLPICLPVCVCLSVCLYVCLPVPVCLSPVSPPTYLSACLSVSFCLPVCLPAWQRTQTQHPSNVDNHTFIPAHISDLSSRAGLLDVRTGISHPSHPQPLRSIPATAGCAPASHLPGRQRARLCLRSSVCQQCLVLPLRDIQYACFASQIFRSES